MRYHGSPGDLAPCGQLHDLFRKVSVQKYQDVVIVCHAFRRPSDRNTGFQIEMAEKTLFEISGYVDVCTSYLQAIQQNKCYRRTSFLLLCFSCDPPNNRSSPSCTRIQAKNLWSLLDVFCVSLVIHLQPFMSSTVFVCNLGSRKTNEKHSEELILFSLAQVYNLGQHRTNGLQCRVRRGPGLLALGDSTRTGVQDIL
jgi:hypothetical protein